MNKVLVKVQRGKLQFIPQFSQCLVDIFEKDKSSALVKLTLEENHVIISTISDHDNPSDRVFNVLQHSPECPIRALKTSSVLSRPEESTGIPVAVSVILESADHHVLLTRRPKHMRSSPGVWVPPGGHLEPNEDLLDGGLRELYEETGLQFEQEEITCRVLCLWENVFPIILGMGEPKSHVLVVYYLVQSNSTHQQLNAKMKIDPTEVEAYAWLSPQVMAELFVPTDAESFSQKQYTWQEGRIVETELKYLKMFNRYVWTSNQVYSGVQCSLLKWYDLYSSSKSKF